MKSFIKKVWSETGYELMFFVLLLFRFFTLLPTRILRWISTYYACNYSYGFIPRGFIGTIFKFVSSGDISEQNAYVFIYVNLCIFMCLLAFLFGLMIRSIKQEKGRKILSFMLAIYVFMPFSLSYLFDYANFGRFDLYLYIITLIQFFILYKDPKFYKLIIATFLSLIAVVIHEAYLFFVFPILALILLYMLYKNNFNKKLLIGTLVLIFSVISSTIYIKFVYEPILPDVQVFTKELDDSTNMLINESCVLYEYYLTDFKYHKEFFVLKHLESNIRGLAFILLFLFPINIMLFNVLKKRIAMYKNSSFKWIILCMILGTLVYLPLFIIASDWGRWLVALYTYLIVFLIFLIANDRENIFGKMYEKIEKVDILKTAIFITMIIIYLRNWSVSIERCM